MQSWRDAVSPDFDAIEALTFDCYGTLIDWEAGLLAALRPILAASRVTPSDDELLSSYAAIEAELEGGPYRPYREILAAGAKRVAATYGVQASADQTAAVGRSVLDWPAFPDSSEALRRLSDRYRLGVITNCDDDLFAASNRRLGATFEWVVTAEQVGSYKPDTRNFEAALARMQMPHGRILHVAQSLYHDHVPARRLGLKTAWIDRRHDRPGFGATPPAEATPDVRVRSMAAFADLALS